MNANVVVAIVSLTGSILLVMVAYAPWGWAQRLDRAVYPGMTQVTDSAASPFTHRSNSIHFWAAVGCLVGIAMSASMNGAVELVLLGVAAGIGIWFGLARPLLSRRRISIDPGASFMSPLVVSGGAVSGLIVEFLADGWVESFATVVLIIFIVLMALAGSRPE